MQWPRYGVPLATHYPYIEAEVRFACQEYACTIEDILSRRTRLAFLNSEAAMQALPRVADIMAEELGWNKKVKAVQIEAAKAYLESFGGRIPVEDDLHVRLPTLTDAMDIFKEVSEALDLLSHCQVCFVISSYKTHLHTHFTCSVVSYVPRLTLMVLDSLTSKRSRKWPPDWDNRSLMTE